RRLSQRVGAVGGGACSCCPGHSSCGAADGTPAEAPVAGDPQSISECQPFGGGAPPGFLLAVPDGGRRPSSGDSGAVRGPWDVLAELPEFVMRYPAWVG